MISRDVLDLNGWWHIWYDEAADWRNETPLLPDTPLQDIPRRPPSSGWRGMERGLESLQVPGTWSISRPGYHGVAWQWRPIFIPDDWHDRGVRLHLEAVRLRAEVYLDEELVGYDLEGCTPFEVDLTDRIRPGQQQELALRITNPGGSTSWQDDIPIHWAGLQVPASHDVGGVWGDVSLIATAPSYVAAILAMPDPGLASVTLRVAVGHHDIARSGERQQALRLSARIDDAAGEPVCECIIPHLALHRDHPVVELKMAIPHPRPWALDSPHCYRAEVTIEGDGFADTMAVTWALRTWEVRGPHFYLNDERAFLRAATAEGWYPHNLAFASARLAEQEVQAAQTLGLNALIFHGDPCPPALLEAADRIGLMIGQELGGICYHEPETLSQRDAQAFRFQLSLARARRLARRDGNHPSLVWWDLASRGLNDACSDASAHCAEAILDAISIEDPTRLMTWSSGGGRIIARNPYDRQRRCLYTWNPKRSTSLVWRDDLEAEILLASSPELGSPLVDRQTTCFAGLPDWPAIVRRYGDRVLPGSDAERVRNELVALEQDMAAMNMQRTFADASAFCRATREPQEYAVGRTIEAHRLNSDCSGLTLNGWSSTPATGNVGLVDIFRSIQTSGPLVAQANAPLTIAVRGLPSQAHAQASHTVELWALNETGPQSGLVLLWEFVAPDSRVTARGGWPVALTGSSWQEHLGRVELCAEARASADMGRWKLCVQLKREEHTLCAVAHSLWVCEEVAAWPPGGQVLDAAGSLGPLRQTHAGGWHSYRPSAPPGRLLLVNWDEDRELGRILLRAQRHAGRVALLLPDATPDRDKALAVVAALLGGDSPRLLLLQNDRLGGWVYSHAHPLLECVAEAGIWGHLQADLFPSHIVRSLPGDALVGGCAFVEENGAPLPRLGAVLSIIPWGLGELLFCALPVVSGCQNHLLSAGHLMHNMARWLVQKS